ncbi:MULTISPECIES: Crp/Fnr family transcriptional regulator [unclassified Adlercreutzia]|uniref:Crp/Fnr family transcriptional regulator n=1 Tax=unclassified Adlercreutzia TaxID=2636013 RepID=UPI0013EBF592|nr:MULTISPECIES: Crp/Fnr family transcriptional regulator [unclassified Adlercreutzia]
MSKSCVDNLFCSNLPEPTRSKLCSRCRQQFLKAGSFCLHESFSATMSVILDGLISDVPQIKLKDTLDESTMPFFTLCFPGRPLSLDFTFFDKGDIMEHLYPYNDMVCLTDCRIAQFDHETVRALFEEDREFARTLMRISMALTSDVAQFSAIMRSESAYARVVLFIRKLMSFGLYLPNGDMARVLACNRASITRAFARLRDEDPQLLADYARNKGRQAWLSDGAAYSPSP